MFTETYDKKFDFTNATDSQEADSTYVMQGAAEEKALDIYHLIYAPTFNCNLRCKHCYLPEHGKDLLPKDVTLRLVDEWNEIVLKERGQYGGIFHVKGGEPFVVPYLWDIIDRLAELQSLRLMMTTNGTFLDDDIFRRLSECNDALDGHVAIIVSLDGATEETHSILRGEKHFTKTLNFIECLRKYGLTSYLNCVVHTGNIHELSSYINIAKSLGVSQVNFLPFVPRGIGASFRQLQIPHLDVYQRLSAIYENSDRNSRELLAGSMPHIKNMETYGRRQISPECVAAYRGLLYITPDGAVSSCPNMVFPEFSVGKISQHSLKEIMSGLSSLHERIKEHNAPYTCSGEKILYQRNDDRENQVSLVSVQNSLVNKGNGAFESGTSMSYCFNRNY